MSRPSSPSPSEQPSAPPANLWSSILDSVSSKRSLPSKQILLLGETGSGRSTIASALLQKPVKDGASSSSQGFALGYDWADLRDEGEEDSLARISVYTVPSSSPSFLKLLPHFLPPQASLQRTLIVIVLDWTKPWTFVDQLEFWLEWVETWSQGDKSRDMEILREENRERLQHHLQTYAEPSPEHASSASATASSSINNTILPLREGTLTHNLGGIPIVVVCSKADLIDHEPDLVHGGPNIMIKGKTGEWEERTDAIMQVLRTICLKYGASLFYTAKDNESLSVLRQHALHLLFIPPSPSASEAGISRNLFPFTHKPNALDRDRINIPAGWDTWGKIGVLREGFECRAWGDAWEYDLDSQTDENPSGAKIMYKKLVGSDERIKKSGLPSLILPIPEQTFLKEHWDENTKRTDKDPRNTFRDPNDHQGLGGNSGVVGPMGSVSFQLPTVERVLGVMEQDIGGAADVRKNLQLRRDPGARSGAGLGISANTRSPASPTFGSQSGNATGAVQHETLQNFFQSLLQTNNRGARTIPRAGSGNTGGGANGAEEGNTSSP